MWWQPDHFAKKIPYLQERARIIAAVRDFFNRRGYLEVDTPALQHSPCMEPHIQAFRVGGKYLHTSPEFAMKKLLVAGLPKIYQLAKVFRDEQPSRLHSPEFTMLEWYQAGMDYRAMMQETVELIRAVAADKIVFNGKTCDPHQPWEIITVAEALKKYADVDIEQNLCDLAHIRAEAARIGVYVSPHDDWENALLKIMMDKVEPHLGAPVPTIITDYPVSMAALSRPKPEDPRFAERFEVYICSIELANAFGELTDAKVQRERFLHDIVLRKKIYGDDYPVDEEFLKAIEFGLPPCSGNALGIDRLVMLLTGAGNIDLVQAAPVQPDNRSGWTALHYMAEAEAQGVDVAALVEELLAAGADPHQPDRNGDTAFNIAAPASPVTGRLMTKHWLAGKGTKGLNERSGSHGTTLAQYIAKWLHDDEIEAAVAKGVSVDLPNDSGWTPLIAAAAMGRVKAVEVFTKSGSPAARTTESYTANYHGSSVTYPAGLDAAGIAEARLTQDKGLSAEMKKNFLQCIKILRG
ncbi:MAG: EF-P lysine aminoacylase GenX [Alphaproteobacteria bacterium]|nr:EF-P lysine aminoacylase GenX [Alphaproteobacteria bacterium]